MYFSTSGGREVTTKRQLPHFGITCLVKPEMNSPLKFLRNMLKLIFSLAMKSFESL
jgi:hypothetical protein